MSYPGLQRLSSEALLGGPLHPDPLPGAPCLAVSLLIPLPDTGARSSKGKPPIPAREAASESAVGITAR